MTTPHALWLSLVLVNFLIQVTCFFDDDNRPLFWAKKITTPLLLFGAFAIVWQHSGGAFSVASIILLAMGVGELGIEGSSVVTAQPEPPTMLDRWAVTLAGLLFLGVNFFLGAVLLVRVGAMLPIAVGFGVATVLVSSMVLLTLRACEPESSVRTQMLLYAPGLIVLAAGAIAALFVPISLLAVAAMILTVSDSLVLVRMGAGLDKARPNEKRTLFALLISILVLYYVYMAVLISTGRPFTA